MFVLYPKSRTVINAIIFYVSFPLESKRKASLMTTFIITIFGISNLQDEHLKYMYPTTTVYLESADLFTGVQTCLDLPELHTKAESL